MTEDLFSNSLLDSDNFKSGYVALIGLPNAGKSTLLNRIIGQKLAIVSDKPQTTRLNILGILNQNNAQLLFVDTPGYHDSKKGINQFFVKEAISACNDSDIIVHLFDAYKIKKNGLSENCFFMDRLHGSTNGKKVIPVLSKIDLIKKKDIQQIRDMILKKFEFEHEIILLAAALSIGTSELINKIIELLPLGPAYYPQDMISDRDMRFLCSELIREKIFRLLHDEIPYSTVVEIIKYKENPDMHVIYANIYVEKDSQKAIVIGQTGFMIKKIGTQARTDIEKMVESKVYLELHVKVKKDWTKDDKLLREFGLK